MRQRTRSRGKGQSDSMKVILKITGLGPRAIRPSARRCHDGDLAVTQSFIRYLAYRSGTSIRPSVCAGPEARSDE